VNIPALKMLTPAMFGAAIVPLADADRAVAGAEPENIRQEAVRLVKGYCMLFGASLDRKTLWDRLATALATACAKVGGEGDLDRWIDLCLEHIRADAGKVVRLRAFTALRETLRVRDLSWRRAFLRYVENHRFAVLAYARESWETYKRELAAEVGAAASAAKQSGEDARAAAIEESNAIFEGAIL
jgi:hypothetical protein